MNTELVTYTDTLDDLQRTAKMLAVSGLFEAKGDSPAAIARIAVAIMAGREMGMGPFAAVQGIHVIQGRPTLAANLMAAAVKAHPRYDYRVRELTDAQATIEFFELAGGRRESLGVSTFTQADAVKAQTKNLDKFARNMLFARAISNGVRWFCPDVFSGNAVYSPEEMGVDVDPETGEILDGTYTVRQPDMPQAPNGKAPESVATATTADTSGMPEWAGPADAQTWAVEMGTCANEYEARNSLKKIADAHGGLKQSNRDEVFTAFYARQMEKLAAQEPALPTFAIDDAGKEPPF